MNIAPFKVLTEAVAAVPAMRYALAAAGIGAIVAIITGFISDLQVAVFGTVVVVGLMFVMLTFATLAKRARFDPLQ